LSFKPYALLELEPYILRPIEMNAPFIRAAAAPDKLMILETTLVTIDYVEQLTTHDMSSHTTGQQMPAEEAALQEHG
jgi:hypothetical protein